MNQHFSFAIKIFLALGIFVIFVFVSQSFGINWGKIQLAPTATIAVSGQADGSQTNQIATFRAGVSVNDQDKDAAVRKTNELMDDLISKIKDFGISAEDIKTEQISVYQYDEVKIMIYPPRPRTDGDGGWQASNNISIVLRNVERASELAGLLAESGATNVSGPNFTVDDTTDLEKQLLEEAMADARDKAQALLVGTNQKIKRIISISEGGSSYPYPPIYNNFTELTLEQNLDIPIEPGSQQSYKTINVVFEIGK